MNDSWLTATKSYFLLNTEFFSWNLEQMVQFVNSNLFISSQNTISIAIETRWRDLLRIEIPKVTLSIPKHIFQSMKPAASIQIVYLNNYFADGDVVFDDSSWKSTSSIMDCKLFGGITSSDSVYPYGLQLSTSEKNRISSSTNFRVGSWCEPFLSTLFSAAMVTGRYSAFKRG